MASLLDDEALLDDAHAAAGLITEDLIAKDKLLDVMGGSAGAILGLLRLHRQTGSHEALDRAIKCARHLLAQDRAAADGGRSWKVPASGPRPLNGMSHGAAGFAHALSSLAAATRNEEFAEAAAECIAYENASYDSFRSNWPDLRDATWPCQWCRGAPGIGLARIAIMRKGAVNGHDIRADIRNALAGAEKGWPRPIDSLCCGTLGSVEFLREAGQALARGDLADLASRRFAQIIAAAASNGDYRWNTGKSDFNIGFFRGVAGVGYTALREVDRSLPNVLLWE
jgi:lantibiotic modifying enzyme